MGPSSPIKGISYTRAFEGDSQTARKAPIPPPPYRRSPSSDAIPSIRYNRNPSQPDVIHFLPDTRPPSLRAGSVVHREPSLASPLQEDVYESGGALNYPAQNGSAATIVKPALSRHSSFASSAGSKMPGRKSRHISISSSYSIDSGIDTRSASSKSRSVSICKNSISFPLEARQSYNSASLWARKVEHELQTTVRRHASVREIPSSSNLTSAAQASMLAQVLAVGESADTSPISPVERIAIRRGDQTFYHTLHHSASFQNPRPIHPLEAQTTQSFSSTFRCPPSAFKPVLRPPFRRSNSTNSTPVKIDAPPHNRTHSSVGSLTPTRLPQSSSKRTSAASYSPQQHDDNGDDAPKRRGSEDRPRLLFVRLVKERVSSSSARDAVNSDAQVRCSIDDVAPVLPPLEIFDGRWVPAPVKHEKMVAESVTDKTSYIGRVGMDETRAKPVQLDGNVPLEATEPLADAQAMDPHSNMQAMNMTQSMRNPMEKAIVKKRWWKKMFGN